MFFHRPADINIQKRDIGGFNIFQQMVLLASILILAASFKLAYTHISQKKGLYPCQSNMRQLSAAIFSYSADWQNRFPVWWIKGKVDEEGYKYTWDRAIRPYLKKSKTDVIRCLKDKNSLVWISPNDMTGYWLTTRSYSCTAQLFGGCIPYKPYSKTLSEIPSPSLTVMLAERPHLSDLEWWESYAVTELLGYDNCEYIDWERHGGAANFAFMDGHVKTFYGKNGGGPGSCPKFPGYTYNVYGAARCGYGDPLPTRH